MNGYLLDTNVLSELVRKKPAEVVMSGLLAAELHGTAQDVRGYKHLLRSVKNRPGP